MQIVSGRQRRPRRIMLYGQHGVGKSSWAACAPKPLFLNFEDGLADIECDKTEVLRSAADCLGAIDWIIANRGKYHTIVIDTLDWLEKLVLDEVAESKNKKAFSEIKFGEGHGLVVNKWGQILERLEKARAVGLGSILLSHARVVRFENPELNAYDRYEPDLHKLTSGMTQEWCDEVLFASFRVFVRTEDVGFGKERNLAVGGKERYIRTNESAAAVAKNRLRLPDELPMTWDAYAAYLAAIPATATVINTVPPKLQEQADFFGQSLNKSFDPAGQDSHEAGGTRLEPSGDIAGLVHDGSSKAVA